MTPDAKTLLDRYQPKDVKVLNPDVQLCAARFSPCGKYLAAGSFDGQVRRWDAASGQWAELSALAGHSAWVSVILFHPDQKRLITADSWGQLRCWSLAEAEPRTLWSVPQAHDGWIRQAALSPDGTVLATVGRDRLVRLWNLADGKPRAELAGHAEDVFAVAFHPDGKTLVSGDFKGTVKHWDLATGKAVRDLDAKALHFKDRIQDVGGVRCLAFDRTGTRLACGGSEPSSGGFVQGKLLVLVLDWASGKVAHTLKGTAPTEGYVTDLLWHPEGFLLGVSSGQPGNGKLFFHRPEDAAPFFQKPLVNCHSLSLHPDGKQLIVCATNANSSGNGRVKGKTEKDYPGNFSPLHLLELVGTAAATAKPKK